MGSLFNSIHNNNNSNFNNNNNVNKSIGSATPIGPKLRSKTQIINKLELVDRAHKTPSHLSNPYLQRGVKSEFQFNKVSSRFIGSENKSRQYPSTSLKNHNIISSSRFNNQQSTKKQTNANDNVVLSRLTSIFNTHKNRQQQDPHQHQQQQQHHQHKNPQHQQQQQQQQPHQHQNLQHQQQQQHQDPQSKQHHHQQQFPQLQLQQQQPHQHQNPQSKQHLHQQQFPQLQQQPHQQQFPQLQQQPHQHQNPQSKQHHQHQQHPQSIPAPRTATKTISSTSSTSSSCGGKIRVNDKVYIVVGKLGSGGSAQVYEAMEIDPNTKQSKSYDNVAIKMIDLARADETAQQSYFNEISILKKLRDNKHVVHMFDSEHKVEKNRLLIVMEKGDADLSQVIDEYHKGKKEEYMNGFFIGSLWRGMVKAVNEIHRHGVVHADLKPVNFIYIKYKIKLIDFGIASVVDPENTSIFRDYQIGTINYMAPESLRNRALNASFQALHPPGDDQHRRTVIKFNNKVDIWSLGCILYHMVYGRPPFDKHKDPRDKMEVITDPRHQIEFPEISDELLSDCMKLCLKYDVNQRPTAKELLSRLT